MKGNISGADVGFSFFSFLGRPKWISELSQSTKKTLFRYNFLRRRPNFEKQAKKGVFRHFLENFDQKIAFFGAPSPLKLLYWRQI